MRHQRLSFLIFYTLPIYLLILAGCSQVEQSGTTPVSISFDIPSANQKVLSAPAPTGITSITLDITASDMEPITTSLSVTAGALVTIDLEIPAGLSREFIAKAFDAVGNLLYQGSTIVDLVAGVQTTVQIDMIPLNPLVGTWGMQTIFHDSIGWSTETNKVIFNSDDTGVLEYQRNINGILSVGTQNFTYTTQINLDGSTTLLYTAAGSTNVEPTRLVFSDNGNMWIADGTTDINMQEMTMGIKLDTSTVYTNTDFSGSYYAIGYGYNSSTAPPAGNRAISGIGTPNGFGGTASSGTVNLNGTLATFSGPGTYAVNIDGSVTTDNGYKGYLAGDGTGMVGGHPTVTDIWTIGMNLKKQDRVYSTADLAGTWAMAGFGDDNGTSFTAEFGTMICDDIGHCTFILKNQTNGNVSYTTGTAASPGLSFLVAADGSFGLSATSTTPSYARAIGNNGNTLIMDISFDSGDIDHSKKEIFIAVRCSTCSNLAGTPTPITIPTATITVDGNTTDWSGIVAAATDLQGDSSPSYTGDDIKALYVAKDTTNLYIRMDLWENVNTNFGNGPSPNNGRYEFEIGNNGTYSNLHPGVAYDNNLLQWSMGFNGSNGSAPATLQGPSYVGVSGSNIEIKIPLSVIGNPAVFYSISGEVGDCCVDPNLVTVLDEVFIVP